ncbi:MAG: glycoside hydrolase family 65 protein, partial [Pseudomonadota bacterium]
MSDGWRLVYENYAPEQEGLRETLCTLGNGVFFTRGAAPDSWADGVHYPGTYLAGGYDRLTTHVAGRDIENEDLVNLPNWLVFMIRIEDGPWLRPAACEHLDYRQELDLERGLLSRSLRFRDPEGRTLRWQERRLMSLQDPHLAGLEVEITAEDWSGRLSLRSGLDGSVINDGVARYRNLRGRHLETLDRGRDEAGPIWLLSRTVQSRLEVAMAARLRLFLDEEAVAPERTTDAQADLIAEEASVEMRPGRVLRAEKIVALHSARDNAISQPALAARERATHAPDFPGLLEGHARAWAHMWEQFDLRLETGDDHEAQLKLRLHLFHLAQTVTRHTAGRDVGVPPRGWTGEAYRAHIMWDELFVFPLFNLRCPSRTRSVLLYRYHRLDSARRLARSLGLEGACFPWQSGSDGREESQVIHLNPASGRWIPDTSNRQRHISSAVAYNVWHYYEVTGDQQFLCDH